ncbi:MAG: Calx-beta domain-containing protein, partial [Gaiellaceae bacterium]
MLRKARALGVGVVLAGLCSVLALALPAGATTQGAASGGVSATSGAVPRGPSIGGGSVYNALKSVAAGTNWVDGMINENSTFLYGNSMTGYLVGEDAAYVGYLADTDAGSIAIPDGAYPQVGDVYYMHVVLSLIGNPGSGGDAPIIDIQLPANTQLAIDSSHPTYCFFSTSSNPLTCSFSPTAGTWLPISLGQVPLASYITFEEQFPVKTTAPLNGLCIQTPPNGTSIPGTVSPACLLNYNDWALGSWSPTKTEFDYQGIYVPASTLDTSISSTPAASTTSSSASFAFSSNTSGATFECALDSGSWAACGSPKAYSELSVGSHTFEVRADSAIDYAGISQTRTDSTPASYSWNIVAPPAFAFSTSAYSVSEAGSSATITINRSGPTSGSDTVHFATANGTAAAGSDYTAVSQDVSFAAGESSKTVSVPIINAGVIGGSKTVSLALSSPSSGTILGSPHAATLTILDNDRAFAFSAATYSVNESGGHATITIKRSGSSSGAYSKTVKLSLSSPSSGAVLGTQKTATLTILDNDRAFAFSAA